MLCNPVVWKVTLLLRYLKLQRITAVQFVYCFRKKAFLSWCFMLLKVTTTCSVNFHPVTFMWNSQNPSFLILFGCPSHSSSFDYSFFFLLLLLSMGQNFAGSRWIGSSPASLRSSTNSSCISTASPTWKWWLVTPTFTATCSRSTTTTTSSRRCQPLTRSSGSSYRDKVSWSTLCDFLRLFIPRRLRL